MPPAVRSVLIALSLTFLAVGIYHRIRAAQSGDKLDRTKEGWPILNQHEARGPHNIRLNGSLDLEANMVCLGCVSCS
jgi:hypothetical protein